MTHNRLAAHPILTPPDRPMVTFTWNGVAMQGLEGEMLSSSLVANGIHIFGHHHRDGSPQGIFCANGQCAQCLVIVDGLPVKSCMTPVAEGMRVEPVEGVPRLPAEDSVPTPSPIPTEEVPVLIIGAGPAGLSAAVELGKLGVQTLVVDDKDRVGGKLVLQTHKFFGSVEDSWAGTRGYTIATILEEELHKYECVRVWLNTTAVGVFSDGVVGLVAENRYRLVRPQRLLVATGARERMLSFPGNTLPGVYGAGAFQTLVNRDLVKSSDRVMVVGGGNVGLIASYHAIQAGIEVVGLVEAQSAVGGYKVHADKLKRLGVPLFTRHTVVAAQGAERVERVTIAQLDDNWQIIPGTHRTFAVDTVLIAVGLAEVDEFYQKAKTFDIPVWAAGDAQEIAEASAAMFSGKIEGRKIAGSLGLDTGEIPTEWEAKAAILRSRPGETRQRTASSREEGVMPVLHCYQEIPCNPCTSVCPQDALRTERGEIMGLPYQLEDRACTGCMNCVAICPGLAITLVDYRKDPEHPTVTVPYEIWRDRVAVGQSVVLTDDDGEPLGSYPVTKLLSPRKYPGTLLVQLAVDRAVARRVVGIQVQEEPAVAHDGYDQAALPDDAIICRCERVTAGEIRAAIRNGVRDLNQLKAVTRAGMGSCGSKTCRPLIWRIFREEGVDLKDVTDRTDRPLFVEVPLGLFAGVSEGHHE